MCTRAIKFPKPEEIHPKVAQRWDEIKRAIDKSRPGMLCLTSVPREEWSTKRAQHHQKYLKKLKRYCGEDEELLGLIMMVDKANKEAWGGDPFSDVLSGGGGEQVHHSISASDGGGNLGEQFQSMMLELPSGEPVGHAGLGLEAEMQPLMLEL